MNMNSYKCICCGTTKESERNCSCPVCGYTMFAEPYDRNELLKKEIVKFFEHLELNEVDAELFEIFRKKEKGEDLQTGEKLFKLILKSEDDQRFPDFKKIQRFVCSADKTETFYERMVESLDEIKKHLNAPYKQEYEVSFKKLEKIISENDSILLNALQEVDCSIKLEEIILPDVYMSYSEIPKKCFLEISNGLLENLVALANKIKTFIKQNNIYGTVYKNLIKCDHKNLDEQSSFEELRKCQNKLFEILDKKYSVDIFSDGLDELAEMLGVFWHVIEKIMSAPIFEKNSIYTFYDGNVFINDRFNEVLLEYIRKRYCYLNIAIKSKDFLSGKTDEDLFGIYNKMIELDTYGYICANKSNLIKIGEGERKLNELIGLGEVKESIKKIKAYALTNSESDDFNLHMCFLGNPGTGKTEVARNIANILYENHILPTNKVIEVDRSGLVSQYFGATAEKTKDVIKEAMGGVLFVDEAYALGNNSERGISDYGKEAIDTLVKEMEDNRGKFCVIFAGYKNEMLKMLSTNPGLKSRIQFILDFPNYSRSELESITKLMLKKRKYYAGPNVMSRILDITDIRRKDPDFANAREIRNILDQTIMCQNIRCFGTDDKEIGIIDINKYISDAKINLPETSERTEKRVLTGEEELELLIGLDSVKRMIKKIKAYAKRNKNEKDFNMHMCFCGNPGTGKTEVARILSRILYDAGVLAEAKLVETDGYGLLGKFVGETAPKTQDKINEAMNGVLFIDEAYGLLSSNSANGGTTNFGEEAVGVLLKEMEDKRGQFCVILAGYKEEMNDLLCSNPGFESRIQFSLNFEDYTRSELGEITQLFLSKKRYAINQDALERVLEITDWFKCQPNFANARTVRNIVDQIIMNQNLRTEDSDDDRTIIISDVEDYITDERIDISNVRKNKKTIGFI